MSENKKTTEEFDHWDAWNQSIYQTGSTQPPKSRGGLIAFLLGLIIFLCGISTALGMMNIKLRWQLSNQATEENCPVAFSRTTEYGIQEAQADPDYFALGFAGQEVSMFWNLYEDLPHGIYVTEVCPVAAENGMEPGDILLSVENIRITDAASLTALLAKYQPGDVVEVHVFRDGTQLLLQMIIE